MKKLKKLSLILLLSLLLSILLTGCTPDSKEIDDQVYTLVIGADKGVNNRVRVTVQFPTYKKGGGESSGGSQKKGGGGEGNANETGEVSGTIVETVESPSLLEAIDILNTSTSRRISLVQSKAIIFSEDLAREGVGRYLETLARYSETRRTMQVIVCRGAAEDFIKENKTLIGESLAKAMELSIGESTTTGFFPHVTFHKFYGGILNPYSMAFASYAGINDFSNLKPLGESESSPLKIGNGLLPGEESRKGDLKKEFSGAAVFDGDKMVGSLNSYETRYLLMVTGDFKRGIVTIEDKDNPDFAIPLDVRLARVPRIKAHFENGIPVIDVNINIEADVGAIQSRQSYEKASKINELDDHIETYLKNGIMRTIEKTQREWGVDIFGFGGYVARSFFTVTEFEKYNWLSHYRDAKVNVIVSANVRRTGLMMSSSPIRNTKDTIITKGEP
ncbi:MAG TPA: Ger(x)C family spore germination protein [Clostridia bacterium]